MLNWSDVFLKLNWSYIGKAHSQFYFKFKVVPENFNMQCLYFCMVFAFFKQCPSLPLAVNKIISNDQQFLQEFQVLTHARNKQVGMGKMWQKMWS